ncbi:MAG: prolipoprotein diacylglyceryl transferase [Sulfuricurvum sp.]|jgi:phosphatidylglycerol:prolipoprotein diacylglycerol transferase
MHFWQNIYEHFNPIAFEIFGLPVHWYGLMYVLALFVALAIGRYFVKKDAIRLTSKELESYFIYIEIGIILGARLGYILFYDPNTLYYLTHPWQIFNPFAGGEFVGIRGMSYHGAVVGFFISSWLFSRKHKDSFATLMDLVAISVPLAFVFGRIGNFLNQELVGRATEVSWGILVDGVLRHPSQLYEALLEGVVLFFILYAYRSVQKFRGELILIYGIGYGVLRFIAEFWREADEQIGYLCCDTITQGQIFSLAMSALGLILWLYFKKKLYNRALDR